MKPNRPKSVTHVSKALEKRDFDHIPELSLEVKSIELCSPRFEIELSQKALAKRLKTLGITQQSDQPAFGLEKE